MAQINTTGNVGIDQATAEIAVALRAEHPGSNDEYCYRQAERLRDAIMIGTRALDQERPGYTSDRDGAMGTDDSKDMRPLPRSR